MSDAYMQYESDDGSETVYRWSGGAYIEVGWLDRGVFQAVDIAANVWDYAAGKPSIPVTLEAFKARCEQHRRECSDCGEHPCECGDD